MKFDKLCESILTENAQMATAHNLWKWIPDIKSELKSDEVEIVMGIFDQFNIPLNDEKAFMKAFKNLKSNDYSKLMTGIGDYY
jgi:hypothetical protein